MNVETITMDPRIAAIHFKDYRKKVREAKAKRIEEAKKLITDGNKMRRTAYHQLETIEKEDIVAMESYRAMMKGARLLNVASAIRGAGLNADNMLPELAIARASWSQVVLKIDHRHLQFCKPNTYPNWSSNMQRYTNSTQVIGFARDMLGAELYNAQWRKDNKWPSVDYQKAQVPTIPAHLRPSGDLDDYFILFEAKWEKEAPPDPILLKHVAGQMYSVLAQWDLTPLEKAVLEGRFS